MKTENEFLVYQYQGSLSDQEIEIPKGLAWKWMTEEDLEPFFGHDPGRKKTFAQFLSKGYLGVLLYQGSQWLSYGWMSTPGTHPPPHLPKWIRRYRPFWLFYAHTRAECRGQGYHKLTMRLRIRRALTHEREIGPIFVDIENWNIPSYRALKTLHFRPHGVIRARKWGIPRVFALHFGKWHASQEHLLSFAKDTLQELAISQMDQIEVLEHPPPTSRFEIGEQEGRALPQAGTPLAKSPLFLEGWLEFNKIKWGLQPMRVRFEENKAHPSIVEAIFYLTKDGKLRLPPGNMYMPLHFQTAPHAREDRVYRQWVEMAGRLADEMLERGLGGALALTPNILDARPWQWAGFKVGVKYTLQTQFPYSFEEIDQSARNRARKAQKHHYVCERTTHFQDALSCIEATSQRQEFQNHLTLHDLQLARELLGDEHFRVYVCYAPDGEPASAKIQLHSPGHLSLELEAGNKAQHLPIGVNQLLTDYALQDVERAGAIGCDFVGANIKRVAQAKMDWNAQLVPYYIVEPYDLKSFAKWALHGMQAAKARQKEQ